MDNEKQYFVSYYYITEFGTGFDNWIINFPIVDEESLYDAQKKIQSAKGYPSVSILFWREMNER